ncbi:MAG: polysaccharide lyase [Hyphomicrobium sp.]|jgi:hypothetical protein
MQNPKHLNLLINVGAALVGVIVVGYVLYSALHTEAEAPCSERYQATRFSLQNAAGKPLTRAELQARAGLHETGIIDNASVVPVEGGPAPVALEVQLRKMPTHANADNASPNGIDFHWTPPGLTGATATCLAYDVWLDDKFAFGGGGQLPGVFGGLPAEPGKRAPADQLTVNPNWDGDGYPAILAVRETEHHRMIGTNIVLPTNRWLKIELETVLNTPGVADGVARLWIDGDLIVQDTAITLRQDEKEKLNGLLAAASYRLVPPVPGTLRLSHFEIGWR